MNKRKKTFTATHYAAASFTAAIFSLVAVLAVVGGAVRGETEEADPAPAVTPSEPAAAPDEKVLEVAEAADDVDNHEEHYTDRPMRRGPGERPGPPSFDAIDANGDDSISREEFDAFRESHRPPGPRGMDRGDFGGPDEFDGPPRGPRGPRGEFRDGPGHGGPGEFRGGPGERGPRGGGFDGPPRGPHGGPGEFRGGPGGDHGHHGPPPHVRGGDDEFRGGPRHGGPDEMRGGPGQRPPRPDFEDIDADDDGTISKREFDEFRPPRGPRGPRPDHDGPHNESEF